MNTEMMVAKIDHTVAMLPDPLRAPAQAESDGIVADMWARPPSDRWTADRGTCPGEPTYFLDLGADDPLENARIAIVPEETPDGLGEVFDLYYGLSPDSGGVKLGRYGALDICAAAGEWVADHLPATMRVLMFAA
jgi:hypothetical protein